MNSAIEIDNLQLSCANIHCQCWNNNTSHVDSCHDSLDRCIK